MATKNMRCTCEHFYQDAMCGPNQRIHVSPDDGETWRCTICGAEKDAKGKPMKKEAEAEKPPAPAAPEKQDAGG